MFTVFYNGYQGVLPAFTTQNSLENRFLNLPEETQQLLLRKGGDTDEGLRRRLDELSRKE